MSATKFASFAQYTPPPDEQVANQASSSRAPIRPWFPSHASSSLGPSSTSYQSGGLPTFGASAGGGIGSVEDDSGSSNMWETTFGWRVDVLAAVAYLGGPLTALLLLILETSNDYVRFHSYQSALSTTPAILLIVFGSLVGFPSWLLTILIILLVLCAIFMAYRAYRDASMGGLSRYHLPWIGEVADKWVGEE